MSNIQLGNYTIQNTQGGCLVRDKSGKIVFEAPTEQDAAAFIKEKMNKENDFSKWDTANDLSNMDEAQLI